MAAQRGHARKARWMLMSIDLTPIAAEEVRELLRQHGLDEKVHCLRVGVKGLGPQRQFMLAFGEADERRETVAVSHGVRTCYSTRDADRLAGVVIDFREVGGVRGFTFELPTREVTRQERQCDCDDAPPDEQRVREALRCVIDPEVGINIVDLGLVYGVAVDARTVRVTMTMTTPACPLGQHIRDEVHSRVLGQCPGAEQVEVELVWDPPWSSDKISAEGKQALGWSR
jgi:metal-sulfur cluster biosynthetic enzyme/Fe-S cluster assembly iron-binding protein IscA